MKPIRTIEQTFIHTAGENESALIVYLTAGFPDLEHSMHLVRSCVQNGADIIEIGIPFSDPVADGPSIQYSSQKALEQGVTMRSILNRIQDLDVDVPIVIMSYLNPILSYGWSRFLKYTVHAHVAGLIIPDLPVEEAGERVVETQDYGLDLILLAAPTSTTSRLHSIADRTRGFIYCVSTTGTTGIRASLDGGALKFLERVKTITDIPCVIGFGISKPEHIQALRKSADGVVVGSRIIEGIRNREDIPEIVRIMKETTRR